MGPLGCGRVIQVRLDIHGREHILRDLRPGRVIVLVHEDLRPLPVEILVCPEAHKHCYDDGQQQDEQRSPADAHAS